MAEFAAATAGVVGERLEAIQLAVGEAVANVAAHAYPDREGLVHVSAAVVSGEVWVLVADDGCGLQARGDSPGLGQGLRLIAYTADELTIVGRSGGGTELRMRFAAGERGEPTAGQSRGSVTSDTAPASSRFSTTT